MNARLTLRLRTFSLVAVLAIPTGAQARWLNSDTGTFTSRSPLPPIAEHPYTIAGGNPASRYDPDGLSYMPGGPFGGVPMPTNPVGGTFCSPFHWATWGGWRYPTAYHHPLYDGGMMPTRVCPVMQVCVPLVVVGGGGGAVTYLYCEGNNLNCEADETNNDTADGDWGDCDTICSTAGTGPEYSDCMARCMSGFGW